MAEDSRKLFVAGLPDSVTEDVLRQLFEATGGTVAEVSLPKDRATGRPRGFGFVTMSNSDEANGARDALHGSFQGGRSISVRPFESDPPKRDPNAPPGFTPGGPGGGQGPRSGGAGFDPPDRKLYIGNLPYDTSQEEVEGVITAAGAGPVVRVLLPSDPDGRKRGFGFVTMASAEAAKEAVDLLKGAEVRGRRLVVNPAHQKGERPPRDDRGPQSGGYGGPPRDFGGGGGPPPFRAPGPPGGGGPDFPRGGAPAPQRKTFDDRRKKNHDDGGGAGAGGRPARGGGGRKNEDWNSKAGDWDADD